MKLWVDVNDLFVYARHHVRPSGIQRLSGELYFALVALAPSQIGFVVHGQEAGTFRVVEWSDVEKVYALLSMGDSSTKESHDSTDDRGGNSPLRKLAWVFSRWAGVDNSRGELHESILETHSGVRSGVPRGTSIGRLLAEQSAVNDLRSQARAGDFLCSFGAPWWHDSSYARHVEDLRHDTGIRLAFLVYDLIPLVCPEFYDINRAPSFGKTMRETLPLAEVLLTISRYTATEVSKWAVAEGLQLKSVPQPIPVGSGFAARPMGQLPPGLEAGGFVLFVATIEVRKNHLLAFRVWQRMLQGMPRDSVPTLVVVGAVGWMVTDLLQAIGNTQSLGGKIVLMHDVDDSTLVALYRACRFTIFPSYYEGWGLPVSDSLAFGKLCIASDRTSIPEAGGEYCLYIDPDNTTGAYEVIRKVIEEPSRLWQLEERIRRGYRAVAWTDTAQAILDAIDDNKIS